MHQLEQFVVVGCSDIGLDKGFEELFSISLVRADVVVDEEE